MSSEVVIFDKFYSGHLVEISKQEAARAGFKADVFVDGGLAAESIGFYTVSVISSVGYGDSLQNPLQHASWLDLPKAILLENHIPNVRERRYICGEHDALIARRPEETAIASLRRWFESIKNSTR
jgi:hypothetical protein